MMNFERLASFAIIDQMIAAGESIAGLASPGDLLNATITVPIRYATMHQDIVRQLREIWRGRKAGAATWINSKEIDDAFNALQAKFNPPANRASNGFNSPPPIPRGIGLKSLQFSQESDSNRAAVQGGFGLGSGVQAGFKSRTPVQRSRFQFSQESDSDSNRRQEPETKFDVIEPKPDSEKPETKFDDGEPKPDTRTKPDAKRVTTPPQALAKPKPKKLPSDDFRIIGVGAVNDGKRSEPAAGYDALDPLIRCNTAHAYISTRLASDLYTFGILKNEHFPTVQAVQNGIQFRGRPGQTPGVTLRVSQRPGVDVKAIDVDNLHAQRKEILEVLETCCVVPFLTPQVYDNGWGQQRLYIPNPWAIVTWKIPPDNTTDEKWQKWANAAALTIIQAQIIFAEVG